MKKILLLLLFLGFLLPFSVNATDEKDVYEFERELDDIFNLLNLEDDYWWNVPWVVWDTSFDNDEISISPFWKYNFEVWYYKIDKNSKFYNLELTNTEDYNTTIWIKNIAFTWKESVTTDILYDIIKNWNNINWEENKQLDKHKVIKTKFLSTDSVIEFSMSQDFVEISIISETSENNFQFISLHSNNIKNKSFLNWLKVISHNMRYKITNSKEVDMKIWNFTFPKKEDFYVLKSLWEENLLYSKWDIKASNCSFEMVENIRFLGATLSSLLESAYNISKEVYFINYIWIKKFNSWGIFCLWILKIWQG